MTRNLNTPDGAIVTRPGRRMAHMMRAGLVDPKAPRGTLPANAQAVLADPELGKAIGDLSNAIRTMVPKVLGTGIYILDANGQATDQYRLPYGCLSLISESANKLTVASSPPQTAAPGKGPGAGRVPANGFAVLNLSGHVWTIYGGIAGELVTVTAYAVPQPPAAGKLV